MQYRLAGIPLFRQSTLNEFSRPAGAITCSRKRYFGKLISRERWGEEVFLMSRSWAISRVIFALKPRVPKC
jgi:hypothetical protein